MGRGTSDTARQSRGDGTRGTIRLTRAAIDNWSRLTHASEDLATARRQMIQALHRHGDIVTEPPEWMTSGPAGAEAYCNLPGKVTLLLSRIEHEEYSWQADNAVAPKGVRRQARKTGVRRNSLSGKALEEAMALSGAELSERIHLSKHALEQFEARGGRDQDRLREAIIESGKVLPQLPDWANPNRTSSPALVVELGGDLLAMPLAPPVKGEDGVHRFVAVTSISRDWADRALPRLHTNRLPHDLHISSNAARMRSRELGGTVEGQRDYLTWLIRQGMTIITDHGAPEVILRGGERLVLFAADADQRATTGKTWVARSWRAGS